MERIATVRTESRIPGLVDRFASSGVPVIVLKGPVTRLRYYGRGDVRPTGDVDLLVAPRTFRRAARVLREVGYRRVRRAGHSDTFAGADGHVDLHLALPYATRSPGAAFGVLSRHTTALTVAGRPVPVLDVPAHVVHLALHAAQNGFADDHRSLEEWRRGRTGLSVGQLGAAEALVAELGADRTWSLAMAALEGRACRGGLVAGLPVRRPAPSLAGVQAFAGSPIPPLVKLRATEAFVRRQLADAVLDDWRAARGLPPVPPRTVASGLAKARRILVASTATIGGRP